MEDFDDLDVPLSFKEITHCCALSQISAGNITPIEEIQSYIDKAKWQKKFSWWKMPKGGGERAFFVIVSPGEEILENNIKKLKFKKIAEFERRVGYPETGILKMYFINF